MKGNKNTKKYTADFETCVWLEDETFVWAWAVCSIETEEITTGNNIDYFMKFCEEAKNPFIYFHNLKFDGEFIIYWLEKNGFKHVDSKEREDHSYSTLISDMGLFYSIEVYFKVGNKKIQKVTFYDSLKILNFSVKDIAKQFNLPISKLEIDYMTPRERGHVLTEEEEAYIKNDVLIVAKALKSLFDEGLTKMTAGSNALFDYKKILGESRFKHFFPALTFELDKDIRKSYKGGFTYMNPIYKEIETGLGVVLDVNSLYPSVMYEKPLPFGVPCFYQGKYEEDHVYSLYIQMITCSFELKKDKIPTIQIKNQKLQFLENEYLESSKGDIVCLVLTSIDLKLFLEQYDVYDLQYICGWKFKAIQGLFTKYIDKWIEVKNQGTITGNKGQRTRAKLMLNSLYGKFSTSMECQSKIPYMLDDIIHYELGPKEEKNGLYIPIGSFITSYAREKTIRTSQAIKTYSIEKYGKDLYCYSDTDSIHCLLPVEELKQFCDIDDVRLGAWKHESSFTRAKFVRQKTYVEEFDGELKITCAGMPQSIYKNVTFENFKTGFSSYGKLAFKHVKGGVILIDTEFTIKEDKLLK